MWILKLLRYDSCWYLGTSKWPGGGAASPTSSPKLSESWRRLSVGGRFCLFYSSDLLTSAPRVQSLYSRFRSAGDDLKRRDSKRSGAYVSRMFNSIWPLKVFRASIGATTGAKHKEWKWETPEFSWVKSYGPISDKRGKERFIGTQRQGCHYSLPFTFCNKHSSEWWAGRKSDCLLPVQIRFNLRLLL